MRNDELMSQPAVCCKEDDTLMAAAGKMWDNDCGSLPIVDAENRLCGMLTDRDICMAAYTRGSTLQDITIRDVMTRDVACCTADDTIENAEDLMRGRQIRRVPVVNADQQVVGVLSMNDIARQAASAPGDGVTEHDVVDTLAAICQPRSAGASATPPPM